MNTIHRQNLIHEFNAPNSGKISFLIFFAIIVVVTLAGIGTGFFASKTINSSKETPGIQSVKNQKTEGILDKKTFKDSALGLLKEGGFEGEGNFHLERTGGISQNVYLTSSIVDLSQYIGKKVKVYGETFKGQKAGWLMDVGLIEVL